jgi:ABC-2 type transport system permease protein
LIYGTTYKIQFMKSILFKEIRSFFGSPVGALVILVFLLLNGLFLWVFEGEFNILNSGFADLGPFFNLAPWILLLLIPSVTMRSFAEEKKQGTLELLFTKPISTPQIIIGKFLGAFVLVVLALLPTLVYVYVLNDLSVSTSQVDLGSTMGSYLGLLLLAAGYISIGLFCSSLTDNQIVAFIGTAVLCFSLYFGFEGIGQLIDSDSFVASLGMHEHFKSMGRGVLDSRDVIYFLSLSFFFGYATHVRLNQLKY